MRSLTIAAKGLGRAAFLGDRTTILIAALCAIAGAPCLQAQSLRIAHAVVSQSEDGPPLEKGSSFQPGDLAFFSFQIENYKTGPTGKIQLSGHIQAFDSNGIPLAPQDEEVIGTSLSAEDKDWKPKLRAQIQVPGIAPPGAYNVRFDVSDQQSHQAASGELTFSVGGKGVEPFPTLVIRNMGFYRTAEQDAPLKIPAYRAGDMLWVGFDITGYKYGEQHSIDVTYDVAVLTAAGKQLFSQENAAIERSQAFYPQPWVPGSFSLSLQSSMTRGTYTLVITAHDAVGHQTATASQTFQVE